MRFKISELVWMFLCSSIALLLMAFQDFDRDGLDDAWEAQYGFSTNAYSHTNLIGWWQLDQLTNQTFADRSTNNRPLSILGSSWQTSLTNGLFSNAVRFNGINNYLNASTNGPSVYSP